MLHMIPIQTYKSPFTLVWEITDCCNLTCSHCRASAVRSRVNTNEEIENKIISNILENDIFVVNISGGEPLVHPGCISIIRKLTSCGVFVGLSTNGMLFPRYAEELKEAKLGFIQISLDGSEEKHNRFRNSNQAFGKAVEALRLAKKMGFRVQLNCVENKYNLEDIEFIYRFAQEEEIEMHVRRYVPTGYGKDNLDLMPGQREHFRLMKQLQAMKDDSKVKISIESPLVHFVADEKEDNLIGCSAGVTQIGIDKHGNVFPCIFFREKVGNILESGLESIWLHSEKLNKIRNRDYAHCQDCSAKIYCGGCQACAEKLYGSDPLCPVTHRADEQEIRKIKLAMNEL